MAASPTSPSLHTLKPEPFKLTEKQVHANDLLASRAMYCALGGGSRSGKTFVLVRAIILRAMMAPESRHVIFRFRFNSVHGSIVSDTLPKVMKLCFPGLLERCRMVNSPHCYLELPNHSQIWFAGLDDKERVEKVLGQEFATEYFNECSQIPYHSVTTAHSRLAQKCYVTNDKGHVKRTLALKAYYDFNPPSKRHWTYLRFVEKKDPETNRKVLDEHDIGFMYINPDDNWQNLSPEYKKILENLPPAARKRFMLGQFADDTEGALWTQETIEQNRFIVRHDNPLPKLVRIVIAVDPSGCSGPEDTRSDEIGIVVAGLGTDGHMYVLEDLSGRYGPSEWAGVAVNAYQRHEADCIIGEVNYGGAMVEQTIRAASADVPFHEVHATRGKVIRAEPISTLYDRAKVHHVGHFPEMEDQLNSFTVAGYQGIRSPDRADALIWAGHEFFPGIANKRRDEVWVPPNVQSRQRSVGRF